MSRKVQKSLYYLAVCLLTDFSVFGGFYRESTCISGVAMVSDDNNESLVPVKYYVKIIYMPIGENMA